MITDVKGSTVDITRGRYKEVNGVGVASIVTLLNAVKPLSISYVFGGEGANGGYAMAVKEMKEQLKQIKLKILKASRRRE